MGNERAGSHIPNAGEYLRSFREQTRRVLSDAMHDRRALAMEIRSSWGPALRRLEANLYLAHHLGREFNEQERGAQRYGAVRHALFLLHANACLIGSEIVILLRTGHANGAAARWRSLHEATVIS